MQEQFATAQNEAASTVITGKAGGGAVTIDVTGELDFQSVHIDPAAVDPDDVSMLEDLVLAALRDAADQLDEIQSGGMGGLDLGGLDLGGMMAGLTGGEGGMPDLGGLLGGLGAGAIDVEGEPAGDDED
ncbi:MAG: YbaB/EbfC family nucleoid-associated protein [Actinomycetia bacterium]|nr:YbaB/EbfC family nucleoid-associated protein [Actinomycetes bacterium]